MARGTLMTSCWPTCFNAPKPLVLAQASPALLPSKQAWVRQKFRHFRVGQQYRLPCATLRRALPCFWRSTGMGGQSIRKRGWSCIASMLSPVSSYGIDPPYSTTSCTSYPFSCHGGQKIPRTVSRRPRRDTCQNASACYDKGRIDAKRRAKEGTLKGFAALCHSPCSLA